MEGVSYVVSETPAQTAQVAGESQACPVRALLHLLLSWLRANPGTNPCTSARARARLRMCPRPRTHPRPHHFPHQSRQGSHGVGGNLSRLVKVQSTMYTTFVQSLRTCVHTAPACVALATQDCYRSYVPAARGSSLQSKQLLRVASCST